MMQTLIRVALRAAIILSVLTGFRASTAGAYCVVLAGDQVLEHNKSLYRFRPGRSKAGFRIPVYVVTSGRNSVLDDAAKVYSSGLGLTKTKVIEEVTAVARAISETPADVRLYYAGEVDTAASLETGDPLEAIVIGSEDDPADNPSERALKVATGVYGSWIHLKPQTPDFSWTTNPAHATQDGSVLSLRTILLHEMGHSLGLMHLDSACDPSFRSDDYDHYFGPSQFIGVMRTSYSFLHPQYLRRDDVEGLIQVWGPKYRTIAGYSSPDGTASSWQKDLIFNTTLYSNVPIAASVSSGEFPANGSYIVFTDIYDRVYMAEDFGSGYSAPISVSGGTCNGGDCRKTVARPAVAFGNGKLVIAWVSEPTKTEFEPRIRLAMRSGSTWSYASFLLDTNGWFHDFGLGYDPSVDRFVLSSRLRDTGVSTPHLLSEPLTNDLEGGAPAPSGMVATVGAPRCMSTVSSDCMMAFNSTSWSIRNERLHISSGQIVADGWLSVGYNSYGAVDSATIGTVSITTFSQNTSSSWAARKSAFSSPVSDVKAFNTNYWPLAVGTRTSWAQCGPFQFCDTSEFRAFVGE